MGGPAFFVVEFSDLVHESPETLELSSALHQVRGSIRHYSAKARSKTFRACFKCSSVTVSGGSKRTFSPAGPAVMHRTPFSRHSLTMSDAFWEAGVMAIIRPRPSTAATPGASRNAAKIMVDFLFTESKSPRSAVPQCLVRRRRLPGFRRRWCREFPEPGRFLFSH